MSDDVTGELHRLQRENAELKKMLEPVAPIVEEAWALRVFESAKSYLIGWITFGGVTAIIAGVFIFSEAWSYAKGVIDDNLKATVKAKLPQMIQAEVAKESKGAIDAEITKQVQDHFAHNPGELIEVEHTVITGLVLRNGVPTLSAEGAAAAGARDVSYDLSAQMLPVRNMGVEGAVVGFGVASVLEYQVFKVTGEKVRLSPREIYNLASGSGNTDQGTTLLDGLEVAHKTGAVAEADWPYKAGQFAQKPPAGFSKFRKYKAKSFFKVNSLENIKAALRKSGPLVAGMMAYDSLMSENVAKTGVVPMPGPSEGVIGGHVIVIVGYDDRAQRFKFQNFWGAAWGDKGYGYLPYSYVASGHRVDEIYSVSF